jgi:hypothetical protein
MGLVLSDANSTPDVALTAYVLGFAGWLIGGLGTAHDLRRRFDSDPTVTVLCLTGWGVGSLPAVLFGLEWLHTWNGGYWGPIVGVALGGAIGGALTLPVRSLPDASPARLLWLVVRGAVGWGAAFLALQTVSFYIGYILTEMTVDPLVAIIGHGWSKVPGMVVPAAFCGHIAARSVRRWIEPPRVGTAL